MQAEYHPPHAPRHLTWPVVTLLLSLTLGLGAPHRLSAQQLPDTTHLELRFLDVGHADAILIRLGGQAVGGRQSRR